MSSIARPLNPIGVVEAEPVGDPCAAVVTNEREPFVAQRRHEPSHIGGHRTFGVRRVVGLRRRLARVAVPAKVGDDHRARLGQRWGHLVPHHVGLRVSV
jgi:hypothetical protein